jgi:TonB-linked SusC/RagA family outer membrane protein
MKRILTIIYLCLFFSGVALAQQQTVTGTVRDNKESLIGVSVYEKDLPGSGTITDPNGNFKLSLRGKSRVLVFKYVGYLAKEVSITGAGPYIVVLAPDAKGLEEVIVVGFGTQKKITNTGAVSSISGDEIRQTPAASLQNTLIGRVPGVVTQQRSGRPGSDGADIRIRGLSTSNGTGAPLIIVDDLEYSGGISEIDPDQIETFTVLKDAATTAVYGIKGANGVVVITTRRGRAGKPLITLRSETGLQIPIYIPKYIDAYTSAFLTNQALTNDGGAARFTDADLELFKNGNDPYGHPNVNWTDELVRKSTLQTRNNINIQGGADKAKYFVSAGYLWQNGLLKDVGQDENLNSNFYYKRYTFRSNLDVQASKTLSLSLDLSGVFGERNDSNIGGRNGRNNVFFELSDYNQLPPFAYPIYNPDGTYGINSTYANNNVVGRIALNGYNRSYDNDLTANFKAVQKLDFVTKGLSARGVFGYNAHYRFWRSVTRANFPAYSYNATTGAYNIFNTNYYRTEVPNLGYYSDDPNSYKRPNLQASLNYDNTFGKHHTYGLALYNQQTEYIGTNDPYAFQGFTFRAGYDFQRKYLIEFNAGYNGSSRFPSEKRYNWFPAGSIGWNVAEESFFKNNIKFIDLFKIRGSYGLTGSDEMSSSYQYQYIQRYVRRTGTYANYSFGEVHQSVNGIAESTLANDVTWEKETKANIGLDINMFKGSLKIVAEYFRNFRSDILVTRQSVPSLIGVGLPPSNITRIQNRGFDGQISYNGRVKNLDYFLNGTISIANNKVIFQDEPQQAYPWLQLTGHPLGSILGYTFEGFYTQEEIDNPQVPKLNVGTTRAGDLKYFDRDGNGTITTDDRSVLPYPNLPNTILGFTLGFSYKGFSFTATAQSALNFALRGQAEAARPLLNNFRQVHLDAWTPTNNINPTFPRLSAVGNISDPAANPSDFWFRRSDYLRIKTAEIGYSLPKEWLTKVKLNSVRLYTNAYNLFTWSLKEKNIYDIDPENPSGSDGSSFYPQQKVINFGLQVSF